jgi:hypothetical protein
LEWFRRNSALATSTGVFSLYLRALGETGELDELLRQLDAQIGGEISAQTPVDVAIQSCTGPGVLRPNRRIR